jgi:predicted nucleic acid-binding protein
MTKRQNIVFDSWPLIAYLQGEGPAKRVIEILVAAHDRGDSLAMSTINAGEVWYIVAQRRGPEEADRAINLLRSLGIKLIDVDWATTKTAAAFKAKGGISYADCFAAALAKHNEVALITGDREFKQLEKEIEIIWL